MRGGGNGLFFFSCTVFFIYKLFEVYFENLKKSYFRYHHSPQFGIYFIVLLPFVNKLQCTKRLYVMFFSKYSTLPPSGSATFENYATPIFSLTRYSLWYNLWQSAYVLDYYRERYKCTKHSQGRFKGVCINWPLTKPAKSISQNKATMVLDMWPVPKCSSHMSRPN